MHAGCLTYAIAEVRHQPHDLQEFSGSLIDLKRMVQIDTATNVERAVRCIPKKQVVFVSSSTVSAGSSPFPFYHLILVARSTLAHSTLATVHAMNMKLCLLSRQLTN